MNLMQMIQHKLATGDAVAFAMEVNSNDATGATVNVPNNEEFHFEVRPAAAVKTNLAIVRLSVSLDGAGSVWYRVQDSATDLGSDATLISNMDTRCLGPKDITATDYRPRAKVSAPAAPVSFTYNRGRRFTGHDDIDLSAMPLLLGPAMSNPKARFSILNQSGSAKPAYAFLHCVAW